MSTFSVLDFERELSRQRELADASRLGQFEPRTLSRLALLPEWTTALAERLGLAKGPERRGLLDRLGDANLIDRREMLGDDGRLHEAFWVRASARAELANHLAKVRGSELAGDLAELAKAVSTLVTDAPSLRGWLEVVERYLPDPTGLSLIDRIDELLDRDGIGVAGALVATARGLGDILGGALADSARRAQWRIDRAQRTAEDEHHLRHYFRRESAEAALDDLLSTDDDTWALHLLGDGGVGKTMVLRYLAAGRYAADRGIRPFPVARADFDHLDPRYPQQRPGELLIALAQELSGFGATRSYSSSYRQFLDAADALHEDLARSHTDATQERELLTQLVEAFAQMLSELSSPVVLVLDTCEELAKLYGLGATAPAIDRTFGLLELLHRAHDGVRVILAGRRWLVPAPDERGHAGGPLLQPRPYLTVQRVVGFSAAEANGYLDDREQHRTGALSPTLRGALLDRGRERDGSGRYNPFELSSYCEWVFSEPDLDPQELLTAPGDPYVERRILGRLGDGAARDGLAVAADLGRFDLELAAPAWLRQGLEPSAAFEGLAAQEWVKVLSLDGSGRPRVIEIDEHLRDRIRAVTAGQPTRYPVDRRQLGRDAADVIRRTPIGDLPSETVEAAVRALPAAEAAGLWQYVEEQVTAQGAWGWAAQVTARVGAVEIPRAEANQPSVLAAVLATQAAAQIHTGQSQAVGERWRDVERAAPLHPDAHQRAVLAARAALGRLAAGHTGISLDAHRDLMAAGAVPAGSVAAALERGFCAASGPEPPPQVLDALLLGLASATDDTVRAVVELTTAVRALRHDPVAEPAHSDRAIALAEQAAQSAATAWADWIPPRGLLDRCRFVRLLVAMRLGRGLESVWEEWRHHAMGRLNDVDAERLIALSVQYELGRRSIPAKVLEGLTRSDVYAPERQPSIWPHLLVRPLAVELADAWSALGEPERARDLLTARRDEAVSAGVDPETIEACDLALLRLCRRYRTVRYSPSAASLARSGPADIRAEAWLVLTLVRGERPADPQEAGSWGGWWRCQDAHTLTDAIRVPPPDGPGPATSRADLAEYTDVARGVAGFATKEHAARMLEVERDLEHERLTHELRIMREAHTGRLLEDRIDRYRAIIASGDTNALALQLAQNPDDVPAVVEMLRNERLTNRKQTIDFVTSLVDSGAIDRSEIDQQVRDALDWLRSSTSVIIGKTAEVVEVGDGQDAAPDTAAGPWLYHLEELARRGPSGTDPSGVLGRATLAAAETSALRFPEHWTAQLRYAAGQLSTADDRLGAEQALVLAGLAAARAGDPAAADAAWRAYQDRRAAEPPRSRPLEALGGWDERVKTLDAYLKGAVAYHHSPELNLLPTERPTRTRRRGGSSPPAEAAPPPVVAPTTAPPPHTGSPFELGQQPAGEIVNVGSGPPTISCGQCGAANPADRRFCRRCGASLAVLDGTGAGHAPPTERPRPTMSRPMWWFLAIAFVLTSLLGVVALRFYLAATNGDTTPAEPVVPGGYGWLNWLGGVLIVAAGAGLAVATVAVLTTWCRGYRFRVARRVIVRGPDSSQARVQIAEHARAADLDGGWLVRLGARLRRDRPRLTTANAVEFAELGAALRLPARRGRRSLAVLQLDVDHELEAEPWEARIRAALPVGVDPVVIYRCAAGRPARPTAPRPPTIYRGPDHLAPPDARGRGVTCLVGTPVRTAAGWRLRVPRGASAASKAPSRGTTAGEELLALAGLDLGRSDLVVLQAEPVDDQPRGLGRLLPGFVGLARDALDNGATAVLVLPPLTDSLAAAALALVWDQVAERRSPRRSALVVLLAKLRTLVRQEQPDTVELDTLLFLRP